MADLEADDRQDHLRPLVVDLDGTLLATDMLWESAMQLWRRRPWSFARLWLSLRGERGALKAALAERMVFLPERLPWNPVVLDFLRSARAEGRPVWLATASDERLARAIADHLGLFDRVMGSHPGYNCKAWVKRERIEAAAGPLGYDYIGDSSADLPIFAGARRAWVVGAGAARLRASAWPDGPTPETLGPVAGRRERIGVILRMARPRQWGGNLLVFAPLLLTGHWADPSALFATVTVFVALCLTVSGAAILDGLLDAEYDRQHPRKRFRPIAAGQVVPGRAVWTLLILLASGFALGALAGPLIFALIIGSFALGLLYTRALKRRPAVGIPALVALYGLRVWAGAMAAGAGR